ncbi:DUF2924 domain-containing protein [Sphingomonas sp. RS2018]
MSGALEQQVHGLNEMSRQQLTGLWRDLYKAGPPVAFTPDLLARGIAWRMQEKALGGLSPNARRVVSDTGGGGYAGRSGRSLKPGNRLVRRWRGRTYVVEVVEDGMLYEGERFSSLSVIAGKITGTRWSGPKFFGLVA